MISFPSPFIFKNGAFDMLLTNGPGRKDFDCTYGGTLSEMPARGEAALRRRVQGQFTPLRAKPRQRQFQPVPLSHGVTMRTSTLLAIAALCAIPLTSITLPAFADQQSETVKNCKKDPDCRVGKKDKTGGVVIYIEGSSGPIIYCQPKLGCDVYKPSTNRKLMAELHNVLGSALN
jgi:hypothetical protein